MQIRIALIRNLGGLALAALAMTFGASPASAALRVFACEPEWAALAMEIGGDNVSVYSATTALQDPHQVQARPSLIARLRNAELLFCTGAELEIGWLPLLLTQSANGNIQPGSPGHLMAADHVRMLEVPARFDRSLGDVHPFGNPHIQTGPQNFPPVAKALLERLTLLDPGRAAQYQVRYNDFLKRWDSAMKRWATEATPLKGVPILAHHGGWIYLEEWLGLQEVGTLEPKPGVPPSAAHLNELLLRLKAQPARMVIRSPYDAPQASAFISEQQQIPQVLLPFSVGGTPAAKDLFSLFDDTLQRLLDGLQGKSAVALNVAHHSAP